MRSIIMAAACASALAGVPALALAAGEPEPSPDGGSLGRATAILQGLPGPGEITNPDWESKPSGEDIARFFPAVAQFLAVEGRATLSCTVAVSGILRTCAVVAEAPKGLGFGQAALSMSAFFKMRPMALDGRPISGGTVRIPLRFQLPKTPPPPAAAPAPDVSPQALTLARRIVTATLQGPDLNATLEQLYTQALDMAPLTATSSDVDRAIDGALRAGLAAYKDDVIDSQARSLASRLTIEEMTQVATFVETPAGRAWMRAQVKPSPDDWKTMMLAMANAQSVAHEAFCRKVACALEAPRPAAGKPAKGKPKP